MDGQLLFILAVHEAGHWVAAELLGGEPKKVTMSPDKFSVRSQETGSRSCDLIIAAAGYAAEKIICGRYLENSDSGDSRAIRSLGSKVEPAINAATSFLKKHKVVVASLALVIHDTSREGRVEISSEELQPYYELAQTVSVPDRVTR